jgi:hypothetical protein
MHNNRRCAMDLTFLALILSLSLVLGALQLGVDAHLSGYTGSSTTGCNCHSSSASSGVTVTITGQPAENTPLKKNPPTNNATGGPAPGGVNQGGFDLGATGGFFTVPTGSTAVQISGGEATHTKNGAKQRQWVVDWTAPSVGTGPITFNVIGMSTNGDGSESGDQWNKASYTIGESPGADTVYPVISISSPTENQQFAQGTTQVQVSGTASDNVGVTLVEVSKDGTNWQPATGTTSWTATMTVTAGVSALQARAKDTANNIGTAKVNITVKSPPADTVPPSITITEPTEGTSFPSGTVLVNISGTSSDNVAVVLVEVTTDGVSWAPATGTTNWSAKLSVQTGNNTLQARAKDAASNAKLAIVNITVKSQSTDMVPPTLTISDPTADQVLAANTTKYRATGTAGDNIAVQRVEVSMDGTTWSLADGTTSWGANISVKAGPNILRTRVTDTSGNTALSSVIFSVAIPPPPPDKTPPVLTIDDPKDGDTFPFGTKSVQFHGNVTDNKGVKDVQISTDGANFQKATGNATWTYALAVSPGDHKITVRAQDLSGNLDTHTITITVLPDTSPPLLVITSHSNGAVLKPESKKITLTGQAIDNNKTKLVEVSKDNKTWVSATGTSSWSARMSVSPGKNTFYVRASDETGNTAYAKVEVSVFIPKQNLWPLHAILLSVAFAVALIIFVMGWRIRRDKSKTPVPKKILRRKLHIYIGPVFTSMMVIGLIDGFWNRLFVRGIFFTTIHGYLATGCTIFFLIGGIIGSYMSVKRPTDILRRVHLISNLVGTILLLLTVIYGVLLVFQMHLVKL